MHRSVLALLVVLVGAFTAHAQPIYPEYSGSFIADTAAYSVPDFGAANPYWVRNWNAPGYYAFTEPDTGQWFRAVEGKWDGIAFDQHFLYAPRVHRGKVFFYLDGKKHYFEEEDVVQDPRLTNWWMGFFADSALCLFKAVEQAACTAKNSDITNAIIAHMVKLEFVRPDQFRRMTWAQIHQVMVRYTNLALSANLERTRALIERPLYSSPRSLDS